MGKHLVVDDEKCIGCNCCILTCSSVHENYFSFAKSRIQVRKNAERAMSSPKVCIQCVEAPCISSCPVDALSRDEGAGAIRLDSEACTGCRDCVSACPYEGIFFDEENLVPLICDLCGGDPACIEFCKFPEAITCETA